MGMQRFLRTALRRPTFTRQGALSRARRLQPERALTPLRKVTMLFVGSGLIGIGVTLFRRADLGLPPFDVFLSAVSEIANVSHGQASWVIGAVLFAIAAAVGQRPSLYGVGYVVLNGVMIDAIDHLIGAPESLGGRLAFVLAGTATIATAVSIVAHSTSTGGAFELLTRAAELRGIQPARFRTGLEVVIFLSGVALGGVFGVATVVFALGIGVLINATAQGLADHRAGRQERLAQRQPVKAA